jgi:hypothetical protein
LIFIKKTSRPGKARHQAQHKKTQPFDFQWINEIIRLFHATLSKVIKEKTEPILSD